MIEFPETDAAGPEQTRKTLILAALKLFGARGFEATSTRALAAEAGANIGSIAYHFGGKEGLRLAAADPIVETMKALAARAAGGGELPATPEQAERELAATLTAMLGFIAGQPEAGAVVQFILRELSTPTAALDRIYSGVFEPVHKRACAVWGVATGEASDSAAVKLAVFTMIGQIVYFRIGREAVLRRMGWTAIGPDETRLIVETAVANLAAMLDARRKGKP